jgi:hypothetical protein
MKNQRCTWLIEPVQDGEDDEAQPVYECGRAAVTVFTRPNPRGREPDQPMLLRYPRCTRHDTDAARRTAIERGYGIEELTDEA